RRPGRGRALGRRHVHRGRRVGGALRPRRRPGAALGRGVQLRRRPRLPTRVGRRGRGGGRGPRRGAGRGRGARGRRAGPRRRRGGAPALPAPARDGLPGAGPAGPHTPPRIAGSTTAGSALADILWTAPAFGGAGGLSAARDGVSDVQAVARVLRAEDRWWPRAA